MWGYNFHYFGDNKQRTWSFRTENVNFSWLKKVNFGTEHVQFFLRNNNIYFKLITGITAMVYLTRNYFLRLLRLPSTSICIFYCCLLIGKFLYSSFQKNKEFTATLNACPLPALSWLMICHNTLSSYKESICFTVLAHLVVCTECTCACCALSYNQCSLPLLTPFSFYETGFRTKHVKPNKEFVWCYNFHYVGDNKQRTWSFRTENVKTNWLKKVNFGT